MIKVLFAPDWRTGVPYQDLLAKALSAQNMRIDFLDGYKRIFPLRRLLARTQCDVLHLHWPERYYPNNLDRWDWFRRARFAFDFTSGTSRCAIAYTAHNLYPHSRAGESFVKRNARTVNRRAEVIFAHSVGAKDRLVQTFDLPPEKICVIPHGDLAVTLGPPADAAQARASLDIPHGRMALMFGTVEPYKGLEEAISWWIKACPDVTLAIVGRTRFPAYGDSIRRLIGDHARIIHHLGWLPDDRLRLWLSAADAVVLNYRDIFTSGAAALARSYGVPLLVPRRLTTLDLDEPSPHVRRFDSFDTDFAERLREALAIRPDFGSAAAWRAKCAWDQVARVTAAGYRQALERAGRPIQPSTLSGEARLTPRV